MELFAFPIKPNVINQRWGVHDPSNYQQFGFTDHNGIDLRLAPDKKIYAPIAATVVRRGYQPEGGGNFLGIITDPIVFPAFICTTPDGRVVQFAAGTFRVLIDFLHCETILVNEGDRIEVGALLAIGDNTGFSTGTHCHTQWRRELWDGKTFTDVDKNDANNSFDPTQFETGEYAQDLKADALRRLLLPLLHQLIAALIQKRSA